VSADPRCDIRIVCRLKPGECALDSLLKAIEECGWKRSDRGFRRDGVEIRIRDVSLSGDEAVFSAGSVGGEVLEDFVKAVIRRCWYADVYYHVRGDLAKQIASRLGLGMDEAGGSRVERIKLYGVPVKLEIYPLAGALTASHRVGWSEVNRGIVSKIYRRILGGSGAGRSLLDRVLGWIR